MRLKGKFGEINVGDRESTAVITNPILERKHGSIVTFSNEKLQEWIRKLKIHSTEDGSIKINQGD